MFKRKAKRKIPRWMRWLTRIALWAAVIATLSYGAGAHIAVRYLNPAVGAWWNAVEFEVLQFAASGLGMIVGIRAGVRFVAGDSARRRARATAAVLAMAALFPVTLLGARFARIRWTTGGAAESALIGWFGYDTGKFIDKLLAAGVYSIKISAGGFLIGMIVVGLASALFMTSDADADANRVHSK